jgi:aerobic-type carbon monoxide dehydrogenase small subunit (CoxS/CutS family)
MTEKIRIGLTVNDVEHEALVEPRTLLTDLLRDTLGLRGTHVGCEQGVCGSCTVLLDGTATRACLLLAVQANGRTVQTVESLARSDGTLHPIQQAFTECHGLQCGFCTPGMLMAATELLAANPTPKPEDVRAALSGNLCRCTGYQNIVDSVCRAGELVSRAHTYATPEQEVRA